MATDVIMPQMGESIAEGTVTRWMVAVGQPVKRDDPLLEISTDKVDAEIPSPATGTLLEVLFAEGETVEVDTVIARIGEAGEQPQAKAAVVEVEPVASPAGASTAPPTESERLRKRSSPVVRKIAAEHDVDVDQIEGTGIGGRVTKRDIEQFIADPPAAATPPSTVVAPMVPVAATPASTSALATSTSGGGGNVPARREFSVAPYQSSERVRIEPMSKIRQITAAHMLYSQETSAHVTTVFEVDMSSVVAARKRAKDGFLAKNGTKLTFMPFLFQAVTGALREFPKFNASIDGNDIVFKEDINLGMAVALDWGLIVPVIKSADHLNLAGLASRANDLAGRARDKQLKPEEVQGGTFTVTNPGVFGSLFGTPIINQPQVAILCIGAIEKRPVVVTDSDDNDSLSIRSMAYIALSYDHRLIDGADAEMFMSRVKETLATSAWEELDAYC